MAAEIVKVYMENLPALRLIGKRYTESKEFPAKWSEWFENGWFEQLKKLGVAPENGYAYLGVTQVENDCYYWIGMLFPPGTPTPDGFEYAEIPAARYAVFGLDGKKDGELFGEDGVNLVGEEMRKRGLTEREDGCGIERYGRPRFAAPDEKGNVLFEFLTSIK